MIVGLVIADVFIPLKARLFRYPLSRICHQHPDRCFYVFGQPLALCARCLGIYSGFVIFYKAAGRLKIYHYLYAAAAVFLAGDLFIEFILKIPLGNLLKFAFGLVFSFFLMRSLDILTKKQ